MRSIAKLRAPAVTVGVLTLVASCSLGTGTATPTSPEPSPDASSSATPLPTLPVAPSPTGSVVGTGSTPTAPMSTTQPAGGPARALPGAEALITSVAATTAGYTLSGLVVGIIDNGGTCTFSMTMGTRAAKAERSGLADASGTSCGSVQISSSQLSTGTWRAVLTYSTAAGTATSAPVEVTVP